MTVAKIKLIEFLNAFVDRFQDIQLVSGRTGEILTNVNYFEDSGFCISDYANCPVLGISPDKIKDEDRYYIRIMLDTFAECE